jgi:hypothetical protein
MNRKYTIGKKAQGPQPTPETIAIISASSTSGSSSEK